MRTITLAVTVFGLLAGVGCATNPMVANGVTRTDTYFGDLGITGNGNVITIADGSRVPKLSLIGNNNSITVEEGATIQKIEFLGKNNTVSIPDYLYIRTSEIGSNRIVRRPRERRLPTDWSQYGQDASLPPAYMPPPNSNTTDTYGDWEDEEPTYEPPPTIDIEPPPPVDDE